MQKIVIHSVPRSGSTWLGAIFDSHPQVIYRYQPLFSYAFKSFLDEKATPSRIDEFFKQISQSNDDFINQKEDIEKGKIPVFKKEETLIAISYKEVRYHHIVSNLLEKTPTLKAIFLVRNPLATLYSWKNAPREFKKELGWKFDEEWLYAPSKNAGKREEYNGYAKWKEAALLFLKLANKYPNNVRLVCYEDLIKNPLEVTKQLFDFCHLNLTTQTTDFLKSSTSVNQSDPYSVFKTKTIKDNHWHSLPLEIINYIKKDLANTQLEKFLHE